MIRSAAKFLLVFLSTVLPALAETAPSAGSQEPIINFSLPTFTSPDGYRNWLLRGSQAWMTESNIIDIKELSLTVFSGDASNRIDTLMLSPSARVLSDVQVITGDSTLRVIDLQKEFEAAGTGWRYTHKDKTVILNKKVRVVFRAPLPNILK